MGDPPPREPEEFRELAAQHRSYLLVVALRLSGDPDRARDLVQDTLTRGLEHVAQYQPGTNLRAWLATILTRRFLDQLKRDDVALRAVPELRALVPTRDDGLAILGIPDAVLWHAVKQLEPALRAVVELRYVQQLSYKQIASRLAIPVGTVSTRLMRAHERLREALKKDS
jgi:RNA polymerase sigma-70 factor (ECF subfamily)